MANGKKLVPEAQQALDQIKNEVAMELGIFDYENMDKGNLPSKVNGQIGGNMVKKLVEYAQASLLNNK